MSKDVKLAEIPSLPWRGQSAEEVIELLRAGELTLLGLLPWSSNYTFLAEVSLRHLRGVAVYKPSRGEQPLSDFPSGTLANREAAAYVLSRALAWDLVPPTVVRRGPHGYGSVQLFVNADQGAHYFTFRDDPAYRPALQALALFDVIANNADRKGGHCLSVGSGSIVAIDQGLCFGVEPKLRTVVWSFAGEAIPAPLNLDLRRLANDLDGSASPLVMHLSELLSAREVGALRKRVGTLLEAGCFPEPPSDRRPYPWPLV